MDKIITFYSGSQTLDVYVDDVPEDATDREVRDMALDIIGMNMYYDIREA